MGQSVILTIFERTFLSNKLNKANIRTMARCKTLPVSKRNLIPDNCPNFSKTGSITGMKKLYYGMDALLVKCGSYIYNVSRYPDIWHKHAH